MKPVAGGNPQEVFDRVPFIRLLGLQRESAAAGRARLVLEPRAELGNVVGGVHGGALATLLDVAMASAAVSACNFERTVVTLAMNTTYLAPAVGRLTANAELLRSEGGVAWCRADITNPAGQAVASAQGSFRYLPFPKGPEPHGD